MEAAGARTGRGEAEVVVVIPTLNEEQSIGGGLRALPRSIVRRAIIADGGSTDGTVECAVALGAEVVGVGPGYGRACLAAAERASPGSILVFMDGDGADDPNSIPKLADMVQSGACDLVLGSRLLGEREPGSMAWHQLGAGLALGWMIRALYGVRYTDMCAFRAIRRETLLGLGMRELTYGWNLEMQMRAARSLVTMPPEP